MWPPHGTGRPYNIVITQIFVVDIVVLLGHQAYVITELSLILTLQACERLFLYVVSLESKIT